MTSSSNLILQHYIKLTEFLGKALGPDYEVALHDLTRKDRSIIAIANNYISGREVGAPLTNMALSSLRDKSYEHTDYHLHYYSINVNGKDLRSSTFFIKDSGKLIGLLCINFDSADAVALDAINRELERMGVTPGHLTHSERLQVITSLESAGIFLLKGAIKSTAAALGCSTASIYRYLSQITPSD